jgi:hypothetical protein
MNPRLSILRLCPAQCPPQHKRRVSLETFPTLSVQSATATTTTSMSSELDPLDSSPDSDQDSDSASESSDPPTSTSESGPLKVSKKWTMMGQSSEELLSDSQLHTPPQETSSLPLPSPWSSSSSSSLPRWSRQDSHRSLRFMFVPFVLETRSSSVLFIFQLLRQAAQ